MPLTIRRVPIASLHCDPANARRHDPRNLAAISDSLAAFGQVEPLVVQAGTGKVIGGNGRLEAMRARGDTEVDVVEVAIDGPKATALGIALNRTAELAAWDDETLAALLQSLPDTDRALAGFTGDDLAEVLDRLTPADFEPVGQDEQGDLSEIAPIVCPACGHQWHR